jgi:RNA polymerase sigma-70 factor (ECF subfamily)
MQNADAAALESGVIPDVAVVERVLGGQVALFEVLMRRHNQRLYRAARAILGDEAEVEDVMQQAYLNAYTHLGQFDRRASFATWLTRIAVNDAIARARRRGRYRSIIDRDPVNGAALDPERQAFSGEVHVILEHAIDALPDGLREVFVLRDVEGLSTAEVAEALGVSDDVIKTRLSRSRHLLRQTLGDRLGPAACDSFAFLRPRCDRVVESVLRLVSRGPYTASTQPAF